MKTPIATNTLVLGSILARHARYRPQHTAVILNDKRLSYADFDAFVNKWANALSDLGVGRGDRVATVLPNSLELLATYWSCAKLGAVAVPLSPLLLTGGFVSLFNDAQPRAIIITQEMRPILEEALPQLTYAPAPTCILIDGVAAGFENSGTLIDVASDAAPNAIVEADDLATIIYTSGTTGLPKGIMHTHFIPFDVCRSAGQRLGNAG